MTETATHIVLPLRKPYAAGWMLSFLAARAIAGIETIEGMTYRRRLTDRLWVEATLTTEGLRVVLPSAATVDPADVRDRLRRLFDLDAEPLAIDRHLAVQPELAPLIRALPGIRVPGCWDPLEGAVRAILGQQVSVTRATALANALCQRFGDGAFPTAETLADADVAALGMPRVRGRAICAVARRVAKEGDGWLCDGESLRAGFAAIAGLGPWTTEYAAMRVSRDPDAFPDSDWGIWKALGVKGAAARRWAEPGRPWRAYAAMLLWSSLPQSSRSR